MILNVSLSMLVRNCRQELSLVTLNVSKLLIQNLSQQSTSQNFFTHFLLKTLGIIFPKPA